MLQDGFHLAYCELFDLLSRQREMQMQMQADFSDVDAVYLDDDPEKLDTLKENLISAETAKRRGDILLPIAFPSIIIAAIVGSAAPKKEKQNLSIFHFQLLRMISCRACHSYKLYSSTLLIIHWKKTFSLKPGT